MDYDEVYFVHLTPKVVPNFPKLWVLSLILCIKNKIMYSYLEL